MNFEYNYYTVFMRFNIMEWIRPAMMMGSKNCVDDITLKTVTNTEKLT